MQTHQSILVHLDSSPRTADRIRVARQLAEEWEAKVTCMPCTLPSLMRYPFAIEGAAQAVAIMVKLDREFRDKVRATFLSASGGSPRLVWAEPLADAPWGFAHQALYADLMILGQRDPEDAAADELPADFLPSLLVESGRPALILPFIGAASPIGQTVLVAWKETREAARAVSAAIPWLKKAKQVHVVCYGDAADVPLQSLQTYLKTQGVTARLHPGGPEEGDAGGNLLSMAADLGADLLVMGCYGHSRAREWVWGGATRTILQSMTLPVLMSH
ncbi:MAG: universal stress protein [Polaromonas sp.]|uniref:universal stress protein n=1 Tax=Polaromonas sp. TaxID=1869339 RepID=UPI0025DE96AB|nr:universal stress protein [Polaromonas sp.]MBI2726642.1 universal stress protein [Polaromonas sp.]